jgi:hypothetical protein
MKVDNSNIDNYVDIREYRNDEIMLCHLSDITRLLLLEKYGGIWVDATTFCSCPLNQWIEPYIQTGFFAFSRPSNDFLFSNWFLYSEPENYLLKKIIESTTQYYREKKKAEIYLIQHKLIVDLYTKDHYFKEVWDNVPVFYAGISVKGIGPMFLLAIDLFNQCTPEISALIDSGMIPLFKLTYKCDFENKQTKKTILNYLFSTIPSYENNVSENIII